MIDENLTDGEVTSGSVTTDVFPNSTRTYRFPRFAQRITRASSPVSMVARRVVRGGAPAIPGDGMARRAQLRHLQTLAKLYGMD